MTPKCQYCNNDAELVTGETIYPKRPDLYSKKFWLCKPCDAYVGCHASRDGTEPLGTLAKPKLRAMRKEIHRIIDPAWKDGGMSRRDVYAQLADLLGITHKECHVSMFDEKRCLRVLALLS